jgi:hypothetical protein
VDQNRGGSFKNQPKNPIYSLDTDFAYLIENVFWKIRSLGKIANQNLIIRDMIPYYFTHPPLVMLHRTVMVSVGNSFS